MFIEYEITKYLIKPEKLFDKGKNKLKNLSHVYAIHFFYHIHICI